MSIWDSLDPTAPPPPASTFDYTAGIQSPGSKGVGQSGSIDQVVTNATAIGDYVGNLTIGPLLGNQYFSDSGGSCIVTDPNDPNNGKTVPRSTFVNNRMEGSDIAADFPSLGAALGGDLNTFDGIVPGMMGDLVATNPITIFHALMLPGVPQCKAYSCPTTDSAGNSSGNQTYYLVPGLEQSLQKCQAAATAPITSPGIESFSLLHSSFEPLVKDDPFYSQALYGLAIGLLLFGLAFKE
jgi:hypothetical protein